MRFKLFLLTFVFFSLHAQAVATAFNGYSNMYLGKNYYFEIKKTTTTDDIPCIVYAEDPDTGAMVYVHEEIQRYTTSPDSVSRPESIETTCFTHKQTDEAHCTMFVDPNVFLENVTYEIHAQCEDGDAISKNITARMPTGDLKISSAQLNDQIFFTVTNSTHVNGQECVLSVNRDNKLVYSKKVCGEQEGLITCHFLADPLLFDIDTNYSANVECVNFRSKTTVFNITGYKDIRITIPGFGERTFFRYSDNQLKATASYIGSDSAQGLLYLTLFFGLGLFMFRQFKEGGFYG